MGIFNWLINIHVLDLASLNQRFLWNHVHGLCFLHNIVVIHLLRIHTTYDMYWLAGE